jgi:hypothetical protein
MGIAPSDAGQTHFLDQFFRTLVEAKRLSLSEVGLQASSGLLTE